MYVGAGKRRVLACACVCVCVCVCVRQQSGRVFDHVFDNACDSDSLHCWWKKPVWLEPLPAVVVAGGGGGGLGVLLWSAQHMDDESESLKQA